MRRECHRLQRKPLDSHPMVVGKPFLAFPAHVQAAISSIWQETHGFIEYIGPSVQLRQVYQNDQTKKYISTKVVCPICMWSACHIDKLGQWQYSFFIKQLHLHSIENICWSIVCNPQMGSWWHGLVNMPYVCMKINRTIQFTVRAELFHPYADYIMQTGHESDTLLSLGILWIY